jgi:sugar porter (SP) family MFS transporter
MGAVIFLLCALVGVGGSLFGYDIGVISGVLVMDDFVSEFDLTASVWKSAAVVSVFVAGNLLGAAASTVLANWIGRRFTLATGSLIFLVGGAAQTFATNFYILLVGRIVAGLGIGLLTMVVPLLISEYAPALLRGQMVSFNQIAMTGGIMVAFWVSYSLKTTQYGWRYTLGAQCIPAIVLLVGIVFLPHSPRWLVQQGREHEALSVLSLLRRGSKAVPSPDSAASTSTRDGTAAGPGLVDIQQELLEIQTTVRSEKSAPWSSFCTRRVSLRLLVTGVCLQLGQNLTGINAIMYYAPSIFQVFGFEANKAGLLAQGINGVVNFLSTFLAFFFVDRCGRKTLLIIGAAGMALSMCTLGVVGIAFGELVPQGNAAPLPDKLVMPPAAGYVAIASVYFYVVNFAYSWGPVCWLMPTELFPLKQRARGVGMTTTANFLCNLVVAELFPFALGALRFKVFLVFAALNAALVLFSVFVVPETRGKSLEALERELAGEPRAAVGVDNDSYLPLRGEGGSGGLGSPGKGDAVVLQEPVADAEQRKSRRGGGRKTSSRADEFPATKM